jgi:hypothetical protein
MHILFTPFRAVAGALLAVLHVVGILLRALCVLLVLALLAWLAIGIWLAWYAGDPAHLIAALAVFAVIGCLMHGGGAWRIVYRPIYWRHEGLRACLDE